MQGMLDAYDESLEKERVTTAIKRKSLVSDPEENEIQSNADDPYASPTDSELIQLQQEEKAFIAANKNSESVERIKKYILNTADPLDEPLSPESQWLSKPSGCCIVS